MEDLTGRQLGPYRIVAPLGEGGMAAVYKAFQAGMDRYVALKILPRQLATDPEFVGRFKQEARVIANLQHPHILPVFDFGEADGYTYIVMPFAESGTLAGLLKGQPLPLVQVRSIVSQIGDALDYAHSQGLVHRDVKPSNVLVDARGNCVLTDFGIAKIVEGTSKFTATGGLLGTPSYMSPEQGTGEPVDRRSDIYSLGVMLYEMATGRVPYQAETPIAVVIKHINDPLPPPRVVNPRLPEPVERVILKAMAKRPNDRYATAGDFVRVLQQAIPETATLAQPVSPGTLAKQPAETVPASAHKGEAASHGPAQPRPTTRRIPAWAWIAGGVVLLVAAGAALLLAGNSQVPVATLAPTVVPAATTASPALPTSAPPTATATAIPALTGGGTGWIAYVTQARGNQDIFLVRVDGSDVRSLTDNPAKDLPSAWSPDGTRLAFVSDREGNSDIFVMNADGSGVVNLTNHPAYDDRPAWSPDGTRIAFYSNREGNPDIFVMNADGSRPFKLTNNPAADYDPAWSPDGARIAFTSERDGNREIYVMDADGANPINVTNHPGADKFPTWSSDSSQIVFESERDDNHEIYVMNADGSNQVNLTKHAANDRWPAWSPDGSLIAFDSDRDGNREIYVMKADGSGPVRLTDVSALDYGPSWQPLPAATLEGQKIGVVLDTGGENDKSFNEYTLRGARDAAERLRYELVYVVSQASSDYEKNIELMVSEGSQLVVTVGFLMGDATETIARKYPNIRFVIVDFSYAADRYTTDLTNVTSLMFAEDEAAFPAGVLAACMSRTGVIATVSGVEIPPVAKYVTGFQNGARWLNHEIQMLNIYIPDFNDPATGKQAGQDFIAQGADVIFGVGGNTGNGGLLAAKEAGRMAVGVDIDQYFTYPEVRDALITSAMKKMDAATATTIEDFSRGKLAAGIRLATVANGGVGLAPYHDWQDTITQACKDKVNEAIDGLRNGTISTGYHP